MILLSCHLDGEWLRVGARLSHVAVRRDAANLALLLDLGESFAALKLSLDGSNRLWLRCCWPAARLSPALLDFLLREMADSIDCLNVEFLAQISGTGAA